jgi:hypothetical protein
VTLFEINARDSSDIRMEIRAVTIRRLPQIFTDAFEKNTEKTNSK